MQWFNRRLMRRKIFGMSDPDHTAARLVAAAERLFTEGGEQATSLRAITREARSNAAAVHYHFGGRDELLRAVLDQYVGPLAERQADLLEGARARYGEPVPVVALIDAVIRPALELLAALRVDRVQVARLLGRASTLPGVAVAELVERRFSALAQHVLPMLRRSLPAVDETELLPRLRLVMAAVEFVFATAPGPGAHDPLGSHDLDEQIRGLVTFCAAGMSAAGDAAATPRKSQSAKPPTTDQKPRRATAVPKADAAPKKRKKR
jgi:AcrR family transcriptional regulator